MTAKNGLFNGKNKYFELRQKLLKKFEKIVDIKYSLWYH